MNRVRAVLFAGLALLALGCGSAPAPSSHGASPGVPCSGSDGGAAGLVAAIKAANDQASNPGPHTIELAPKCTYTLMAVDNTTEDFGANGLPAIASTITIKGHGATITRGSGTAAFRIIYVLGGEQLNLEDVTISGGSAPPVHGQW